MFVFQKTLIRAEQMHRRFGHQVVPKIKDRFWINLDSLVIPKIWNQAL